MLSLEELGFKGKKLEKLQSDNIYSVSERLYKRPRKYMYFDKVTVLSLSDEVKEASEKKLQSFYLEE